LFWLIFCLWCVDFWCIFGVKLLGLELFLGVKVLIFGWFWIWTWNPLLFFDLKIRFLISFLSKNTFFPSFLIQKCIFESVFSLKIHFRISF
jgi:hypothetical protein